MYVIFYVGISTECAVICLLRANTLMPGENRQIPHF